MGIPIFGRKLSKHIFAHLDIRFSEKQNLRSGCVQNVQNFSNTNYGNFNSPTTTLPNFADKMQSFFQISVKY